MALFALATLSAYLGCVTGPDGNEAPDVARIARLIGSATTLGTQAYLIKHPEARPAFEFTRTALKTLQANGNYDPVAFAQAFQNLPINELRGDYGALYVSLAIVAWDELRAEAVSLDQQTWVAVVLSEAVKGFDRALGP